MAILGFRHKGLQRLFLAGVTSGVPAQQARRLRVILARLAVAVEPRDMSLPGLDLHELKGRRAGTWAVRVSGNWRVTFTFEAKGIANVDYEDYH